MADPLRRTLLAKLRGKKSKKSASDGARSQEGKAKLPEQWRRRRQRQQQQQQLQQQQQEEAAGPGVVCSPKVLEGSGSSRGSADSGCRSLSQPSRARDSEWEVSSVQEAEGSLTLAPNGINFVGVFSSSTTTTTSAGSGADNGEGKKKKKKRWRSSSSSSTARCPGIASGVLPCHRSAGDSVGLERTRGSVQEDAAAPVNGERLQLLSDGDNDPDPGVRPQEMQPANGMHAAAAAAAGSGSPEEMNGTRMFCIGVAPKPDGAGPKSTLGAKFAKNGLTHLELMDISGSAFPGPIHACPSPVNHPEPSHRGSIQSHHSLDSEEDDYYENESLQGYYEPEFRGLCSDLPKIAQSHLETVLSENCDCNRHRKDSLDSAQEKERLRTQLQEAYYLLIHAMHDMPMDNPARNRLGDMSTSSCHSQDSVCTQSSVRVIDSDAWSSDDISPQQQVSDTDSLPEFIENVHASSIIKRELKATEANEINDYRPHINNITVSKKRNWLQQSTLNPYLTEETNAPVSVELTNHASSPSYPLQESRQQPAVPLRQNDPKHAVDSTLDHSEENDADDEGEIWYNPIPEDDEVDIPQVQSPPRITVAKTDNPGSSLQMKRPSLPAGDLIKGPVTLGTSANCSESVREIQVSPAIDVNQGNSVNSTNSTDSMQLYRQMCVCKSRSGTSVEEICVHRPPASVAATDPSNGPVCAVAVVATTAATTDFSPPSSPNPLKKGSAINWSFPEKIKSPRTVRKLSMKMKKLPELSRKLSVKGTSSHNCNDNHNSSPKGNHGSSLSPGIVTNAASRNVISRYHLDTSVVSQNYKKKSSGSFKSASKGGYLSDGDSPELVAKSGKHSCESKPAKGNIAATSHKTHSTEIDIDAFRHYSFVDQPKCSQYISGLMSVHFYGAEDLKPPRIDSRDVFCAIQVDSVNKARTALLTCRTTFLDMDHTFNIELENAQHLKLVVFSWEPTPRRNRVCCHGTVVLPTLFRVSKMHQLAVKLEPRGLIYVKLTLMEQWENSLDSPDGEREPVVFGVEARKIVEKENTGLRVPLLMQKCIVEIEKRGCQVVGLYRLCGSAAVKKELREAFERDSKAVGLSENLYPDINVITGVLKDYLRELPSPLITKQLYEAVLETMAKQPLKMASSGCENDLSDSEYTVGLLDCLPEVEKATLKMLLDHLKLVASYHEVNKMTCQNLAVCFGPVLLSQRQEASNHSNRVFTDSEELASALDFKKHIEVLHYLLQLWPVQNVGTKEHMESDGSSEQDQPINYVRRRKQRPAVLNLTNAEATGVLRPRQVRLDSPSNRYAGDWSSCGESYLLRSKDDSIEADYDDVPSEDTGSEDENTAADRTNYVLEPHAEPKSKEQPYEAYVRMQKINPALEHRVNLKDLQESIDTLIGNLERELSKNKLNATC
ncbi:rho GTPase-activating protein SYDE2 isoform X3 [Heptranchias perlo]|uniref:rho GTPase-activating protein SYDE2 isoform X3 n=1 Tax=Heptranchias perlo TaxID=212740 RepID=UPI00355A7B2D